MSETDKSPPPFPSGFWGLVWGVVSAPLRLLAYGLVAFIVLELFVIGGVVSALQTAFSFTGDAGHIATLIFFVGIGFAVFLWWLSASYFRLLRDSKVPGDGIAALKDLPMALPEGTVRAIIALIVGVVGIPILVFGATLKLDAAIAGYLNGIVMSVFSYYFGSRVASGEAQSARQAVKMLGAAQELNHDLQQQKDVLQGQVASAGDEAMRPTKFAQAVDMLDRHVKIADMLINTLGPALPKGLIPDGAAALLAKAETALAAARGIAADGVTPDTLQKTLDAASALVGGSPLKSLLGKAAGFLPLIGGLGPVAGVAIVLSLGWRLGSAQYQRWVARVLGAPYDPQVIPIGQITGVSAQIRLNASPIFSAAFAKLQDPPPSFFNDLVATVLNEHASELLWKQFGGIKPPIFTSPAEVEAGLREFRLALLSEVAAQDVAAADIADAAQALATTLPKGTALPTPAEVNKSIDAAGLLPEDAPPEPRAAFESLVLLTGKMRALKIDPAKAIAEVQTP